MEKVLIKKRFDLMMDFINGEQFIQHNLYTDDGLDAYRSRLENSSKTGGMIEYIKLHRLLAEGNFVLSVSEGLIDDVATAYYDLFRIFQGKLVEHWDTIEAIPAPEEWKNENGKF